MAPKGEKGEGKAAKGEKGEGKGSRGGKGGKAAAKKAAFNKTRALQHVALDPDDDERKATSKKISWILRRGADRVGIEQMDGGWVKMSDLLTSEILDDIPDKSEEKLMSVIAESNSQKLRYETKEASDGVLIRALSKAERKPRSEEEPSSNLQVQGQSSLRADANAFVPLASSGQPMMPGYPTYSYGYPGFGWPYGFAGFPAMPAVAAAKAPAANTEMPGSKRYQGRIKSFNAEKGFGFIESVEAWSHFNRDVFLHKAHVGDFQVGACVTFVTDLNKENMPQARELRAMPAGSVLPEKGSKGKGKGKGEKGKNKEKGKGKKNVADATAVALEPGQVTTEPAPSAATEAPAPAPAPTPEAAES